MTNQASLLSLKNFIVGFLYLLSSKDMITLTPPNYTTQYSYKRPGYMELAKFIIEAKNFRNYEYANIAFVCLLNLSINSSVRLIWQSTNKQLTDSYEAALTNAYRDLLTVYNGILKVNMPVILLKPKYMKYTYHNAELQIVSAKDRWCHAPRPERLVLPGQDKYLKKKLAKLVPNYQELANRYLQPKP